MKRFLSIMALVISLAAAPAALAGQPQSAPAEQTRSALLLLTGAYYDTQGEGVVVTACPARMEVPPGALESSYILIEEAEQTYILAPEAYVTVPQVSPYMTSTCSRPRPDFSIVSKSSCISRKPRLFFRNCREKDGILYYVQPAALRRHTGWRAASLHMRVPAQ